MSVGWTGWWFLLEVDLSGALKVEKGLDLNTCLLPWKALPLPLGSISGDRCLELGPGRSLDCFPPACLPLGNTKRKGTHCLTKADFILCHGAKCKLQKVLIGWWDRADAGRRKALWGLQAGFR